jgi:general secretion pathway protein H
MMPSEVRRSHAAGFTLLELLVVLAVAAIAVSVVVGGAQAYLERARYQAAVRDVTSQLKHARAISLDQGQPVVVTYQPQLHRLSAGDITLVDFPPALQVSWKRVDDAPGAGTSGVEPIFVFSPDGFARGGQLAVTRAGRGVQFGVNWLLGTIESTTVAGGA